MTDREKLIALIANGVACPDDRDPFGEYCDSCRYEKSADCSNERLADHLIAHGVTVQGWIPVTERLPDRSSLMPDESEYVLVCESFPFGGHNVSICAYTADGWSDWDNYGSVKSANITHWMPLPKPPKGQVI